MDPKFRQDLVSQEQATREGACYILKDPRTGQFYRFCEPEKFICEQLDGHTPVAVVRQRATEEFGAELSMETLQAFIKNLEHKGLLETADTDTQPKPGHRRIRGTWLYLRLRLFDPDRLLTRLESRVRFLFTRGFLIFSAVLMLAATSIMLDHAKDINQEFWSVFHFSSVPLLVLVLFAIAAAHEFAHGLTCKHFGGEVHEMGFILIYFQPAFYCNVSDAWLFREKSKRLWVGFAGPYFELCIWAMATVLWRLTDVDTWINHVSFLVMASTGIKTLINFNPLIKLDGYYLLSDYLEIPNLRRRAFRYIGDTLKRLAGSMGAKRSALTKRERRVFLLYGLVATVYSFGLMVLVTTRAGGVLVEHNHPISLGLFCGLVVLKLRQRISRFVGAKSKPHAQAGDPDDFDLEEEGVDGETKIRTGNGSNGAPEIQETGEGLKENGENGYELEHRWKGLLRRVWTPGLWTSGAIKAYRGAKAGNTNVVRLVLSTLRERCYAFLHTIQSGASWPLATPMLGFQPPVRAKGRTSKGKKKQARWSRRTKWLVYGAVAVLVLVVGRRHQRVAGEFSLVPSESVEVRAQNEGLVESVLVDEGMEVKEGQVIARLSDWQMKAELAKTKALVGQTAARLKMLQTGPTPEEIAVAKSTATKAEDDLKYAQRRLERDQKLFEQKLISQQAFDDTQELTTSAENARKEAKDRLEVLLHGSRPELIAGTQAELEGYKTQCQYLERQLGLMEVRSPANGVVVTPSRQLKELRSKLVKKGELLAKVYDLKRMTAEMWVSEKDIAPIKPGQQVVVKVRAYPGLAFKGTVRSISMAAAGERPETGETATVEAAFGAVNPGSRSVLVTTEIDNRASLLKPEMTGRAKIFCKSCSLLHLLTRRVTRTLKIDFWSWW